MAPKVKAPALDYDGPMDGSGKFFFPDGASYSGSWKMVIPEPEDAVDGVLKPKRVRHGEGRFQDGDNVYVGSFHEDLFDGNGTFMFASGSTYAGTWKQGQYCGQGKYEWPDGRHYQGSFVDCAPHGQGTYTDLEGRSWSGEFRKGSGPGLTEKLS